MAPATLPMPAPGASASPAAPLSLAVGRPAVLALDLGTTTGWALRGQDGAITSGTVTFRPSRFEGGGMRYLRFRGWLGELAGLTGGLTRIAFEEVRSHAGTDAAHLYGGFLAHLSAWCEERGVAYEGVPVGTIKRFATGRGNADKAAMIAAVRARGFAPADDNEADAIALLLWATDPQGGRA
uniref:crossover junction endodeoxyribonuclease RuvC n=1 Tax=Siccirubricoccus phaeus TaxID=2595053 RepID=UPI0011F302E8